jgi:methylmalonyl-CoA mutase
MQTSNDIYAGFPDISKQEWLAKITKDLKGKPLDDLYWKMDEELVIDPFAHADDFSMPLSPLSNKPGWEICEAIVVTQADEANRQALEALAMGAEALEFQLQSGIPIENILPGIHLSYIGLHITSTDWSALPPAHLLMRLKALENSGLRGSIAYDPLGAKGFADIRYLSDLIRLAQTECPGMQVIAAGLPEGHTSHHVVQDLAALLHQGNQYLSRLTQQGLSAGEVAAQIRFKIPIGKSYFPEIARLRAFKYLWLNILQQWNAPLQLPTLDVHFDPAVYTDELFTNMIRSTTMAMSAVLGGADRLIVLPFDAGREAASNYPQAFSRRIARNVQHLLKMESFLDQVADPAGGSYYIEKLSRQLATAAWKQFLQNQAS